MANEMAFDEGFPFRRRMRWGRGRRPKPRFIYFSPKKKYFVPLPEIPPSMAGMEQVVVHPDELEACRLVYLEGRSQSDAAQLMGISRGTLWRLLDSGRRKIISAIVGGKILVLEEAG